ncbi:hypothetical protein [Alishewanella sp. HL-SH05]|uniref:hypothetical protein n=1 Tax=Alishewanella sp. HL-SH05 TaxID=3461145 RepID=UPI004042117B
MNRALLIILLLFSIACFSEDEAPETIWIASDNVVSCNPKDLNLGDTLQIKLGGRHGKELAVARDDEGVWLFLIVGLPPLGMDSLMSHQEFEKVNSIEITARTTGYRWDVKGGNEVIFSKPGKYTLYISENLESEDGGYKCEVTVKNH